MGVTVVVAGGVGNDAARGPVVVLLDAPAELQPGTLEVDLFVGERGERRLVGPGRERLDAHRLEIAELSPGPEPAREPLGLPLVDVGAHDVGPVREPRADVLDPVLDLQLVVSPVDYVQGHAHSLDDGVGEVAEAHVEAPDTAARGDVDLRLRGTFPCVYAVRLVELVRERHPVAAVLQREPAAGEEPVAEPAEAGARVRQLGG